MIRERSFATPHDAAMSFHRMGVTVVPLCVGKKRLSLRKGELTLLESRPIDEGWINSQWPIGSKRNVGVRLGRVSQGLIARDFDDSGEYRAWAEQFSDLASMLPTVRTRRGFHVYLIDSAGFTGSADLRAYGCDGEIKGDGTHVVAPGSTVASCRSDKAIQPFSYQWTVAPSWDEFPCVSLAKSGLVPPSFRSATQDTQETQDTKDTQDTQETQGRGGRAHFRSAIEYQSLIDRHRISGRGQRRNALKALCMSIIRLCSERPEGELRDQIFKAWWEANSEHCGTGEETSWLEFDQMLDELRGDGFLMVVQSILPDIEVPFWAEHLRLRQVGREVARIVVACDSVSKGQPFHLSPRTIQKLIGCADHTTPYRNLRTLERKGIVKAIKRGEAKPGGKATTYRLLVNLDGSVRPGQARHA